MRGRKPVEQFQAPPKKVAGKQYAERHLYELDDQFAFTHGKSIRAPRQ
jgi:hypothetical protein